MRRSIHYYVSDPKGDGESSCWTYEKQEVKWMHKGNKKYNKRSMKRLVRRWGIDSE